MNTKVLAFAACLASADAFSDPMQLRTKTITVHHINKTLTPQRCGETVLKGTDKFITYAKTTWSDGRIVRKGGTIRHAYKEGGFEIVDGTCASVGFTEAATVEQDLSGLPYLPRAGSEPLQDGYRLGFRANYNRYDYMIKFFFQPGANQHPVTQSGDSSGGVATPRKTIAQLVVATPELSTLLAAATAAGLVGALSGKGPLTVFAPTNAAFKELGAAVSGRPCNVRREGGKSLVIGG